MLAGYARWQLVFRCGLMVDVTGFPAVLFSCLVLPCIVLYCLIGSRLIVFQSCRKLSCPIVSRLTVYCIVLSCLFGSRLIVFQSYRVLSHRVLYFLVLSGLVLSYSNLIVYCLALSWLFLFVSCSFFCCPCCVVRCLQTREATSSEASRWPNRPAEWAWP